MVAHCVHVGFLISLMSILEESTVVYYYTYNIKTKIHEKSQLAYFVGKNTRQNTYKMERAVKC